MTRWWWGIVLALVTSGCGASAASTPRARSGYDVSIQVDHRAGAVAHNPFARPPVSPYTELLVSAFTELPASPYEELPASPY